MKSHKLAEKERSIEFVWSQYDEGNIDKEQLAEFPPKPQEAKLNNMGGDLFLILPKRS